MHPGWDEEVLGFWFGELEPEDWWSGSPLVDVKVRRFAGLHDQVAAAPLDVLTRTPRTALAAVIALDQFPRNLFRGTARAFSTDAKALAISRIAIEKGYDAGLAAAERQFLYMPLMHSEHLVDVARCVGLFATLDDEESLKSAVEHCEIIRRFGRYPHRNRVLGRQSTEAELSFLGGHRGFGQ